MRPGREEIEGYVLRTLQELARDWEHTATAESICTI